MQSQVGLKKHHKANGDDGIPVALFQILKDDAVRVLHSICQQIWKLNSGLRAEIGQFSFQLQERQCQECSNYYTITLISHASKVMLKILQTRFQQHVDSEHPGVQAGVRKDRGTKDQIANTCWIIKKAREFQKSSISALLTMPKLLTVWITTNYGKF